MPQPQPGQVVLFRFPLTDQSKGKLRPAVLLGHLPGKFDDWLVCMITSQMRHGVEGFDEIVAEKDDDFRKTGLKTASLIRIGRLAVMSGSRLVGSIGQIDPKRLQRIRNRLASWLLERSSQKSEP